MATRPTVALLGLLGEAADPELTRHQQRFLVQLARRLTATAEILPGVCESTEAGVAAALAALPAVERLALVALAREPASEPASEPAGSPTSGPVAALQALCGAGRALPLLIANVQPERTVGEDWNAFDLRFNQGVGAAQELGHTLTRAGVPYAALTGDWLSDGFARAFAAWGRSATPAPPSTAPLATAPLTVYGAMDAPLSDGHRCRMQALDWNRDAILLRPSPGFTATSGAVTTTALAHDAAGDATLVTGAGALHGAALLPSSLGQHLLFAPEAGLDAFLDAWLRLGAAADFRISPGGRSARSPAGRR